MCISDNFKTTSTSLTSLTASCTQQDDETCESHTFLRSSPALWMAGRGAGRGIHAILNADLTVLILIWAISWQLQGILMDTLRLFVYFWIVQLNYMRPPGKGRIWHCRLWNQALTGCAQWHEADITLPWDTSRLQSLAQSGRRLVMTCHDFCVRTSEL